MPRSKVPHGVRTAFGCDMITRPECSAGCRKTFDDDGACSPGHFSWCYQLSAPNAATGVPPSAPHAAPPVYISCSAVPVMWTQTSGPYAPTATCSSASLSFGGIEIFLPHAANRLGFVLNNSCLRRGLQLPIPHLLQSFFG